MARIALIFSYQWRAFWRRFARTRPRAQLYLTMLALLGWSFFVLLPPRLSRAAQELAIGETATMDALLASFCGLWLFVVIEDESVSLTSRRLQTFPLRIRSLLAVRVLSLFCSPVALMIALGSLASLRPFLSAHHPVAGVTAALLVYALSLALAMSVSHLMNVVGARRTLGAAAAIVSITLGAVFLASGPPDIERLRALVAFSPPHLASAAAVAGMPAAALARLMAVLVMVVSAGYLLVWSFRRSLFSQPARREGRTAGSALFFPGRFGGLVRKEQFYYRKLLDFWAGLFLASGVGLGSLVGSPPPIIRQSVIVIVLAMNANVFMNSFGVNTPSELTRYAVLPIRGRDVLVVKNLGMAAIVAAQLALLIATAAWQSGPIEAAVEIVEAATLLLAHLSWGNLVSVTSPYKVQFYRFMSGDAPLTTMAGVALGSAPAVLMLFLLHSDSSRSAAGMAAILLLVTMIYLASLHAAGKSFEHRRQIIGERLS